MSVLIKALEKAAQNRDKAPGDSPSAGQDLSLEALEPKFSAADNDNAARASAGYTPATSRTTGGMNTTRSTAQVHAATVLGTHTSSGTDVVAWARAHPLYLFGGLAGLFLLAYGAYVYVQIFHPDWLVKTPPRPPTVAVAPAQPPASPNLQTREANTPAPATKPATDVANAPLIPLQSVFAGGGTAPQSAATSPPPNEVSGNMPARSMPPAIPTLRTNPASIAATPTPSAASPALAQNRIAITRGDNAVPRPNATVNDAYAALEAGQFDNAGRLYSQVLRSEPSNVDALLGLAAIAQKDNRSDDAQRYFLMILNIEPRHALAQSGLIALMSRADPLAAESRLKQLLAREPSPPLYFNLGNLYADQGQWPQAQQAYFQAHSLDAKNPDYAYNLAVGLEHLGQQKLALDFYRKALQLASARGTANFDPARIQERIAQLSARFE